MKLSTVIRIRDAHRRRRGHGPGRYRRAFEVPADEVERALQVTNDYGEVAVVARDEGVSGLEDLSLEIGRPVGAMLAQSGTVTDALDEWGETAVEWKYDGARVQVHHDSASDPAATVRTETAPRRTCFPATWRR